MKEVVIVLVVLVLLVGLVMACSREREGSQNPLPFFRTPLRLTSTRLPVTILPVTPLPTRTLKATATPTRTPTATVTPTETRVPPVFNVFIPTCDTGIDIFNGLGEVTNAYVTVQNVGETGATGVVVTMTANDEEESHPNKSYHVGYLPAGQEISLKLTVDTRNRLTTSISVEVTSAEDVEATAEKESCKSRRPEQDVIDSLGRLFQVKEIEAGQ